MYNEDVSFCPDTALLTFEAVKPSMGKQNYIIIYTYYILFMPELLKILCEFNVDH